MKRHERRRQRPRPSNDDHDDDDDELDDDDEGNGLPSLDDDDEGDDDEPYDDNEFDNEFDVAFRRWLMRNPHAAAANDANGKNDGKEDDDTTNSTRVYHTGMAIPCGTS